ncbi:hypothetical protein IQ269_02970 [Tychonema sp. LEGE 07199]|uniref:hypothetical protein n=1 Tax=unclassified Tychonema TaxID=2642144 RepID=UPI00187EF600|nr:MULTISPECIES: hypothetical protein [unclassified Tychonema]MBE9119790.1 hypothetical protein [Tychonema sp. LEGE 07199]MBE9132163.1 hypothetical protein [Tychonema sp. LEGE 07196]
MEVFYQTILDFAQISQSLIFGISQIFSDRPKARQGFKPLADFRNYEMANFRMHKLADLTTVKNRF